MCEAEAKARSWQATVAAAFVGRDLAFYVSTGLAGHRPCRRGERGRLAPAAARRDADAAQLPAHHFFYCIAGQVRLSDPLSLSARCCLIVITIQLPVGGRGQTAIAIPLLPALTARHVRRFGVRHVVPHGVLYVSTATVLAPHLRTSVASNTLDPYRRRTIAGLTR